MTVFFVTSAEKSLPLPRSFIMSEEAGDQGEEEGLPPHVVQQFMFPGGAMGMPAPVNLAMFMNQQHALANSSGRHSAPTLPSCVGPGVAQLPPLTGGIDSTGAPIVAKKKKVRRRRTRPDRKHPVAGKRKVVEAVPTAAKLRRCFCVTQLRRGFLWDFQDGKWLWQHSTRQSQRTGRETRRPL